MKQIYNFYLIIKKVKFYESKKVKTKNQKTQNKEEKTKQKITFIFMCCAP